MKVGEKGRGIVIVIVEGKSEIACLKPILSTLYDDASPNYDVWFPPSVSGGTRVWGDFTSRNGITPETAPGCINKLIVDPLLEQLGHLPHERIGEIVHIIDMDGAYIDDSNIEYDPKKEKNYYDKGKIITANVEFVKKRNEQKRKNIDRLCSLDYIIHKQGSNSRHIPYSVYFFSSNLDHMLHGDANIPSGTEKVKKADDFAEKYEDEPMEFIRAIKALPGTLNEMTYEESWNYIRQRGNNSICPHTNINLLLDKIVKGRI